LKVLVVERYAVDTVKRKTVKYGATEPRGAGAIYVYLYGMC
jgi:hypothetical protein